MIGAFTLLQVGSVLAEGEVLKEEAVSAPQPQLQKTKQLSGPYRPAAGRRFGHGVPELNY